MEIFIDGVQISDEGEASAEMFIDGVQISLEADAATPTTLEFPAIEIVI